MAVCPAVPSRGDILAYWQQQVLAYGLEFVKFNLVMPFGQFGLAGLFVAHYHEFFAIFVDGLRVGSQPYESKPLVAD